MQDRAYSPIGRPSDAAGGPILILFVDGVGLGPDAAANPLADPALGSLRTLAGGPLVRGCSRSERSLEVSELDATLGVEGLPQSATGQAALFTGRNAARELGRHVPALPGPRLRAIIESDGLLASALAAGRSATLANAFTPSYLRGLEAGERRPAVTVHLARSAGLALRSAAELRRDQAVTWDFRRDFWRTAEGDGVPAIEAAAAGAHLAAIAAAHDLTLFDTFLTDLAGHGRIPLSVAEALARVDAFVGGVCAALPVNVTLVVCSDHGNVEEPEHRRHTANPVPLVARGPLAPCFAGLRSIVELSPAVLRALRAVEAAAPESSSRGRAVQHVQRLARSS